MGSHAGKERDMIKEVVFFNHPREGSHEETDRWYFEEHAELTKKLPYLARYVGYRALRLPENDFFHEPQFYRMEELWWPDKASYRKSQASDENKRVLEDLNDPAAGPKALDLKRVVLEREINIQSPEMTGRSHLTMNELNGIPHVKGLWPLNYLSELGDERGDEWYITHHTRVAARNLNFLKYVTWSPASDLTANPGFVRFTEQWSRDWQTYLNDFGSPKGLEALEDNRNERGEWRIITKSSLLDYPHVVGHITVFV
jgi:uncharacterized protein (TIGR02118 family)